MTMKNTENDHRHCHASSHCGCKYDDGANSHCSDAHGSEWFSDLPKQLPQRQDSLQDQLHDLQRVATRLGMYDAADYINSIQNVECDRTSQQD